MNDVQTVRPITRQPRLLTERGRMLIMRRRRQNARDDQGRALWEHFKSAVGAEIANAMQFSALPAVFRKGRFTPVYTKKQLKKMADEKRKAEAAQKVAA
jgi:hypothetical protein